MVSENIPFKDGSKGHLKMSISDTFKKLKIKMPIKNFFDKLRKISILCSFPIFQAHYQPTWQSPPYLYPFSLACIAPFRELPDLRRAFSVLMSRTLEVLDILNYLSTLRSTHVCGSHEPKCVKWCFES